MTKYTELCEKNQKNVDQYKEYEEKCRRFIRDLKTKLVEYLGCPDDRIIWEGFSPDEPEESREAKGVIRLTSDNRMALYNDAFYGFRFSILFYDPKPVVAGRGPFVEVNLRVKKMGNDFILRLSKKEQIRHDDVLEHAKVIVSKLEKYLDNDFQSFLEGERQRPTEEERRRPMGFKLTPSSTEEPTRPV